MLRLLHVVPTYYPAVRYGGPIRSVHGLAAALVRRGHEVQVYTTNVDGPGNLQVPLGTPVDLDGVQVHYFPVPALRRLYWSPSMGAQLRRHAAGFDAIHLHSVFLWPMWAAARAAQRAGVPYLFCPRGMLMREVIRRKSRWVKSAWIELVERTSLARAGGVHVTADLEAEEIRALGLPLPRVFCLPNGVDVPRRHAPLTQGPYAWAGEQPYALFLSRINWKKGLDRLIETWPKVPELQLIVAGNDEEGYLPKLEEMVRARGLEARVRFIGPVSDEHKWALYENARLFVLPSYSENFGNVVAEAMAMACPVVVSDAVGIAGLVREAGAGLITSDAPDSLEEALCRVHGDAALRAQLGAQGVRLVREQLSWDAIAAAAEAAYLRIIADDDIHDERGSGAVQPA